MKRFVVMMMLMTLITGCAVQEPQLSNDATAPQVTQPSGPSETAEPVVVPPSEDTENMSKGSLPNEVQQAVLSAVAAEQNVSASQLQVTAVEEKDWPDACLGLAKPDEMCAQMITPGWAVTVTDGQTTWQYRTDLDALQVKLDS